MQSELKSFKKASPLERSCSIRRVFVRVRRPKKKNYWVSD
jgi:hypothetical protein